MFEAAMSVAAAVRRTNRAGGGRRAAVVTMYVDAPIGAPATV
jgi:hypothetical protein